MRRRLVHSPVVGCSLLSHNTQSRYYLSDDLLHIIVEYYTNDYVGLIRFRLVCQQWKGVADRSKVWLMCKLEFCSPRGYYWSIFPEDKNLVKYVQRLRHEEDTITIFNADLQHFPADKYRVIVLQSPKEGPTIETAPPTPEKALRLSQSFLKIFRSYHSIWRWHCKWRPFFFKIGEMARIFLFRGYLLFCFTVGIACQLIACILLTRKPQQQQEDSSLLSNIFMSDEVHLAFLCMYIYGLIYLVLCILGFIYCMSVIVLSPPNNNLLWKLRSGDMLPWLSTISLILGLIGSIALLHAKLAAGPSSSFLHSYLLIPLWGSFLFILVFGWRCYRIEGPPSVPPLIGLILTGLLFFFLPYALCFLIALHYDGLFIYSLHYAVIPLYPVLLLTLLAVVIVILHYSRICIDLYSGHSYLYSYFYPDNSLMSKSVVIFVMETVRLLSCFGMFILALYVLARFHLGGGLTVEEGLLCSIAWSLCFCFVLYIFGFTTSH